MSTKPWKILFAKKAQKQIDNLDKSIQSKIKKAINDKLAENPLVYLEPLVGDMDDLYKFRVGNYRLICSKEEERLIIMVIKLGHRKEVYR